MPYCDECKQNLPDERFRKTTNGKYFYRKCRKCQYQANLERRKNDKDFADREEIWLMNRNERAKLKSKERRASGRFVVEHILTDSRQTDRKKNRGNNLDLEFIRELIHGGCSYCEETNLRMTLDRIDNDLGHLKNNVVPACVRCNYMRRNIPYTVWLKMVPGIKDAIREGLLDSWIGYGCHPVTPSDCKAVWRNGDTRSI